MRLVKKFVRDGTTEFVSGIFDEVITKTGLPLPFRSIEFHIRDIDATAVHEETAMICIDYNNPLVIEKDQRGIATIIRHELFRLILGTVYPRLIEDVLVGRAMIKHGYGDDLFYMYYNLMLKQKGRNDLYSHLRINIPWIVFRGADNYNSGMLRETAEKLSGKKPEAKKLLNYLCNEKFDAALKEYKALVV